MNNKNQGLELTSPRPCASRNDVCGKYLNAKSVVYWD